jgi:hypothetical protein
MLEQNDRLGFPISLDKNSVCRGSLLKMSCLTSHIQV